MSVPALRVDSLGFAVRGCPIIEDVGFTIAPGSFTSILGANGAGKSTLLKCLAGIHDGYGGTVAIAGDDLRSLAPRARARRIAYVPQAGGDERFVFSVSDYVWMGRFPHLSPFLSPSSGDREAVDSAMERARVGDLADRRMTTLSGGECQRVCIAGALAQQADILLLDEPTAFLDYRHQDEVLDLLRRLNGDEGTTILTVTHDVNTALISGGGVLALRGGRLIHDGDALDLTDASLLEAIYGTGFRFLEDAERGRRVVAPREGTGA